MYNAIYLACGDSVFSRTRTWTNTRFYKKENINKSWLAENGSYFRASKKMVNSLENQHWKFHQQALLSNHFWLLPWWICHSFWVGPCLPNNFNHQIYPSDLPVLFLIIDFYQLHLPVLLAESYIVFTLKMEMVKSGLEKIFLKFLQEDYFPLLHKSVQNHKFSNKKKLSSRMEGFQNKFF